VNQDKKPVLTVDDVLPEVVSEVVRRFSVLKARYGFEPVYTERYGGYIRLVYQKVDAHDMITRIYIVLVYETGGSEESVIRSVILSGEAELVSLFPPIKPVKVETEEYRTRVRFKVAERYFAVVVEDLDEITDSLLKELLTKLDKAYTDFAMAVFTSYVQKIPARDVNITLVPVREIEI